jgi:HIV Tat-specific factor 1
VRLLPTAALNQHGGYFKSDAVMFWREDQDGWKPLRELPELHAVLQEAPPEDPAAAQAGDMPPPAAHRNRRKGAAAAAAAALTADPKLAGFLSEISALEAEGGDAAAGGAAADAPQSPPPDERRFEDDDGTVYVWDPSLRNFMPEGEGGVAVPPQYAETDMVMPDEEQQPEYQPPPKVGRLRGWPTSRACLPSIRQARLACQR